MAYRFPSRVIARHARTICRTQRFSINCARSEAHNFMMPAMSPTMTEGNIASWKVKEGDSFSAGDVLLEIETDKASMDVEAQDDGIMAKIIQGDGSKSVAVGTRIAVFADANDDISTITIPEDTSKSAKGSSEDASSAKGKESRHTDSKAEPEKKETPAKKESQPAPDGPGQNPKYPLYPAVHALILAHHIPEEDIAKIPATGPQGRLLKGDVLAYTGQIESEYSKKQSERIEKHSHLDLSNIKVMEPTTKTPKQVAAEDTATPKLQRDATISLPISLLEVLKVQKRIKDALGTTIPLSTFLARAIDMANDDLPRPKTSKASQDELFNAVLGLPKIPSVTRGQYLPQIDAIPLSPPTRAPPVLTAKLDIVDILSGKVKPVRSVARLIGTASPSASAAAATTAPGAMGSLNVFSLTVPIAEEQRAKVFLERMKTVLTLEPGRLVL